MLNMLREIRKALKENNFLYGDGVYYRVINNMFQNVEIRHLRSRKEYRINFGAMPLCAGIKDLNQGCLLELSDFYGLDFPEWCDGWSYLYGDNMRKQACEEAVKYSIQRYLLPFMENCKSSNIAYVTFQKALAVQNESRLQWLRLHNMEDEAQKDRHYFDDTLLYLALKNCDYTFAMNAFKVRNENDLRCLRIIREKYRNDEKLNSIQTNIEQRNLLMHYLDIGCYEPVQSMLYQNEKNSIDFLQNRTV